jgi:hypothetical protein
MENSLYSRGWITYHIKYGGVLAHSSEALFAKDLCVLLASLEIFSSGYGNDIACVFAWKALEDIVRNMEKSLKGHGCRLEEGGGGGISD